MNAPLAPESPPLRFAEFDLLRVVAAAAVVFIHAAATAVSRLSAGDSWNVLFLIRQYVSVAVPAFVFITGALIWSRPPLAGIRRWLGFFRRRFATIVPAYLTWTVLYWGLNFSGYAWSPRGSGIPGGPAGAVGQVLMGTAWVHLYFVPLIVIVYLLTPIAVRALRASMSVTLLVTLALAACWPHAARNLANLLGAVVLGHLVLHLPYAVCGAWYAIRRVEVGSRHGRSLLGGWPLLLSGLAVQTAILTGVIPEMPMSVLALATIAWRLAIILGVADLACRATAGDGRCARSAAALAPLTYQVYLAHPALLVLFYHLTRAAGVPALWSRIRYLPLKWGFAFVGAFLLAWGVRGTLGLLGVWVQTLHRPIPRTGGAL